MRKGRTSTVAELIATSLCDFYEPMFLDYFYGVKEKVHLIFSGFELMVDSDIILIDII